MNGWLPSSVTWKKDNFQKDNFQKTGKKYRRYRSELLASSLLKIPYTDEDTPSFISIVLTRKRSIMYFKRYMKEFAVTMREQGLLREKHLEQVIIGQHYRRMHMTSSKHVTSANALRTSKHDQVSQWHR